jgi:ubiquinone/menaquinone biosynthesis C-methylase UbiE
LNSAGRLDIAYPWFLTHGHLLLLGVALALLWLGRWRGWRLRWMLVLGAFALWAAASFAAVSTVLDFNGRGELPTQSFLKSGVGSVLDMGAGSGRSSIMVLEARPKATLVALDSFSQSYQSHFGSDRDGQERLASNFRIAGVDARASIRAADMRKMPFEPATFDAIVSAYAIDHLGSQGIGQALAEANRVLKPGGEFLLMVVHKDAWMKALYGPLLEHGGTRSAERWVQFLNAAGFEVREQGAKPITLYFLAAKK